MNEVFSGLNPPYKVIYADPPWSYGDKHLAHGGVTNHYSTMALEEIQALPVKDLADDNCLLFLWATFPNLIPALNTINAWGFRYRTLGFSWIKTNPNKKKVFFGMGWYTKSNCEVCLIGVRGKPFKESNSVSSVIISPREEHSKKPNVVRKRIVEFTGDVKRVELFARQTAEGWDSWGNQLST